MHNVLITGGSEGIGFELAKLFVQDGNNVTICARNAMKLQDACIELRKRNEYVVVDCIAIDLSITGMAQDLYNHVKKKKIDVLINNAGCGYTGKSWHIDIEKEEKMVLLNDVACMSLTKLFLKDMCYNKKGTILNISSTGAFQPGPYIAGYYASKAFVNSYTKAVHEEAKEHHVHVSLLCPGPVDTGFYDKSGGKKPHGAMSPEKVAKYAYKRMFKKTVIIPGFLNRLVRIVPVSLRTKFIKNQKFNQLMKK